LNGFSDCNEICANRRFGGGFGAKFKKVEGWSKIGKKGDMDCGAILLLYFCCLEVFHDVLKWGYMKFDVGEA